MSNEERTWRKVVKITGQVFERGPDGWCKHCGFSEIAHIIGAQTGNLLCRAAEPPKEAP